MALNVVWTKRAEKSFENIINYLLQEWGEKVVSSFVKKVFDFIDILAEFPEIDTLENKKRNIRGFNIIKQVSVFYRISENKIILLHFFDNRKNPETKHN